MSNWNEQCKEYKTEIIINIAVVLLQSFLLLTIPDYFTDRETIQVIVGFSVVIGLIQVIIRILQGNKYRYSSWTTSKKPNVLNFFYFSIIFELVLLFFGLCFGLFLGGVGACINILAMFYPFFAAPILLYRTVGYQHEIHVMKQNYTVEENERLFSETACMARIIFLGFVTAFCDGLYCFCICIENWD